LRAGLVQRRFGQTGASDDRQEARLVSVLTRVEVEAGSIDELAQLFEVTDRALVAGHDDWLGAWFTANRDTNEVTVIARRRDVASFEQPRASDSYQGTMATADNSAHSVRPASGTHQGSHGVAQRSVPNTS
jgi:hypothetical protein